MTRVGSYLGYGRRVVGALNWAALAWLIIDKGYVVTSSVGVGLLVGALVLLRGVAKDWRRRPPLHGRWLGADDRWAELGETAVWAAILASVCWGHPSSVWIVCSTSAFALTWALTKKS